MPLKLVLGPANSAKAGEVLGAYALAARRDALLVVPTAADVAHYERELAASGITLGRALTFPRLIEEIAVRARYQRARLTPLQRERVLRRVIAGLRLQTLAGSAAGDGFAPAAGRLIAELAQARVTTDRFAAALKQWAGASAYARELAAIHRGYADALAQRDRVDAEEFAWGALDALRGRPDRWEGTPVFFYGFDDLTPIELDAVETLSRHAGAEVTVSLTYEPGRPALAARATVVEQLRVSAQTVTQLPALDEYYAPASRPALHHLERHLFEPGAAVTEPGEAVALMEAGGARAEAELVAAEVLAALTAGVAAGEIVVVCRSLARSGELYERALTHHGVAISSARRQPLEHTALGRALLALTRYALLPEEQRRPADLIAYLRHPGVVGEPRPGLMGESGVTDRLEADIRRRGWTPDLAELYGRSSALRSALGPVEQLRREREPAAVLPGLVRDLMAAPHRGMATLLAGAEQTDARAAAVVLDALAQLQELDGGRTPALELIELLDALQVPVQGGAPADAVLIAEPLAIRARRFRRVFVTGLCEGEFPAPQTTAGDPFLGDEHRRELALASGLALPQSSDPLDRERYLLYVCVSRATERVTFSYRSSDEDGNTVNASPFLEDVTALFTDDWRAHRRRRLLADVVWQVEEAPDPRERQVAAAFLEAVGSGGSPAGDPPETKVLPEQALARIRHRQVVSGSALEMFAACPVRWLVERQLNSKDLGPDPEPMARGSFIHAVLERVFAGLGGPLNAGSMPDAERLLAQVLSGDDAPDSEQLAPGQPPAVGAAILRGIQAELLRYLRFEASGGSDWTPVWTELEFGRRPHDPEAFAAVELVAGNERALLNGVVDRVDADPRDPQRVIVRDYKSGAKRPTWPVAHWLGDHQIQVALYMIAVRRLLGLRPVGGFYQPLSGSDLRPRGVHTAGADLGGQTVTNDELSEAELESLLEQIEHEAVALAATMRRGELTPCPETCTPNGTCRHPGICWAAQ